jgi:hypothetical protein
MRPPGRRAHPKGETPRRAAGSIVMSGAPLQALEMAIALRRAPYYAASVRARPLPGGVLLVIRIAAGDDVALLQAASANGEPPAALREAATLYLQQALFCDGADSYRVLGVHPSAPQALIKTHRRWLARWLHPDRDGDDWQTIYMKRVNSAWQDLRTAERRRAYNASRTDQASAAWPVDAPGTPSPDQRGRLADSGTT